MAKIPPQRAPFAPSSPQARAKQAIQQQDVINQEASRRSQITALQHDADAWGGMKAALPEISAGMRPSEITAARNRMNFLGVKDSTRPAAPAPTAPQTSSDGASASDASPQSRTAMGGAFRGSTPQETKDFFEGDPARGAATRAADAATTKNAGAGNQVQTSYGPVSSTDAKYGPGATWQEQIANKYPEIGKQGSEANKAFTDAYNTAIKTQGPNPDGSAGALVNPHDLADSVMGTLTKNRADRQNQVSITNTSFDPSQVPIQVPKDKTNVGNVSVSTPSDQQERTPIGDSGITIPTPTTVDTGATSVTSNSGETHPQVSLPGGISIGGVNLDSSKPGAAAPSPKDTFMAPTLPGAAGPATDAINHQKNNPPATSTNTPSNDGFDGINAQSGQTANKPDDEEKPASSGGNPAVADLNKFTENPAQNDFQKKLDYYS